jgi:hypothetical protein
MFYINSFSFVKQPRIKKKRYAIFFSLHYFFKLLLEIKLMPVLLQNCLPRPRGICVGAFCCTVLQHMCISDSYHLEIHSYHGVPFDSMFYLFIQALILHSNLHYTIDLYLARPSPLTDGRYCFWL